MYNVEMFMYVFKSTIKGWKNIKTHAHTHPYIHPSPHYTGILAAEFFL